MNEFLSQINVKFYYRQFYFDQKEFEKYPVKSYVEMLYHEIPQNIAINTILTL